MLWVGKYGKILKIQNFTTYYYIRWDDNRASENFALMAAIFLAVKKSLTRKFDAFTR